MSLRYIEPVRLQDALTGWDATRSSSTATSTKTTPIPSNRWAGIEPGPLAVLIGPEGGFSAGERQRLLGKPFVVPISLGPRIMRADTAAVAVLALTNAVLGDWRRR